jgi:DNA-binding MarR family transcriptional regulator
MSSDVQIPPELPPSVGALLRMAWTEVIEEVFVGLTAAGYEDLRPVHQPILRDLLTAGQRPTELATRLGLSKQAVNDMLRELEDKGYITLEPDPDDGRAKRTVVTERGRRLGNVATQLGREVGRRWEARVGRERYMIFEEVLHEIVTGVKPQT